MKKLFLLLMIVVAMFSLVACGESETDKPKDAVNQTPKESEQNKDNTDVYFKDDEAKIEDLKIEITQTKVIPVGEVGNEYGEKPVFAIWYEATNLTDKDISPTLAWLAVFTAIQDNDPNAINTLEVGGLPDERHLDSQLQTIKKDGTVENSIAYELDDLETPVILVATQGMGGEEIGRTEYNIKQ